MRRMFALESPLMNALGTLADLVFCNVLFCIFSLPLFTAGASLCALYDCTLSIVEEREESFILRQFWNAFRRHFRRGTALGLLSAAVFALLGAYHLAVGAMEGPLGRSYRITFLVLAFLWLAVFQYLFPLQAKYRMKVGQTFKTAALLSAAALPWTLCTLAVTGGAIWLSFFLNPAALNVAAFLWAFGVFAVVAYLNSFFFRMAFRRLVPENRPD